MACICSEGVHSNEHLDSGGMLLTYYDKGYGPSAAQPTVCPSAAFAKCMVCDCQGILLGVKLLNCFTKSSPNLWHSLWLCPCSPSFPLTLTSSISISLFPYTPRGGRSYQSKCNIQVGWTHSYSNWKEDVHMRGNRWIHWQAPLPSLFACFESQCYLHAGPC